VFCEIFPTFSTNLEFGHLVRLIVINLKRILLSLRLGEVWENPDDTFMKKRQQSHHNDGSAFWFWLFCWILLLFQLYDIDEDDQTIPRLTLCVPRDLKDGFVNNKKENYKFRLVIQLQWHNCAAIVKI
jgi:hypothetical protein